MRPKLTGKIRFSTERRMLNPDLVVLQVEEEYTHYGTAPADICQSIRWRNAQVEDITHMDFSYSTLKLSGQ